MSTQLLRVTETAERLGCHRNHVYDLISAGALRAVNIATPGSTRPQTRIREEDLEAYIEKHTRSALDLRHDRYRSRRNA